MRALAALAFLLSSLAAAQSDAPLSEEAFVEQAGVAMGDPLQNLVGPASLAEEALDRAVLGVAATANVVAIIQDGTGNETDLAQEGTGHRFGLVAIGFGNDVELTQRGQRNTFLGDILGDRNSLLFESIQEGQDNQYSLFLDRVSDTAHRITQLGDGNSATQAVGPGMVPVNIEQRGGAQVVVTRY